MTKVISIVGRGLMAQCVNEKIKDLFTVYNVERSTNMSEEDINVCNQSDLVILCCKADASKEIISNLNPNVKVLDTSHSFRTNTDWVYGLYETTGNSIMGASRVANSGCFATSAILLLNPLYKDGITFENNLYLDAVGGVSVTGINAYNTERLGSAEYITNPINGKVHPHVAEIKHICNLSGNIMFSPKVVADCYSGIRMQIMLWSIEFDTVFDAYLNQYVSSNLVNVLDGLRNIPLNDKQGQEGANIYVSEVENGTLVTCTLDNLRFGGASNALRNIKLMLEK